ncbi:citramalate synthase [Desulforhabdus amnigena]|jgi:2-isopropylmalate synthase|uniref:Citramalate synthase n=1 Tax=Desulforhabdus amnigena TaxID=40218 RepID=A0A9W6FUI9_9BACT|nr:citramalate synthase [Desulforhabdus amnigena]NLJ27598.1 citramalate synthase [Deltaproteobacteria bacterium]GLI35123.1 (R)-citramalate synthase [Desulforhabdus amnigena]
MQEVRIYDTTLRDGTQAEDFSLSLEDKIRIALKLDDLGIHYVEGGWPGSNPKDVGFFEEIRKYELKQTQIAAFGATHHPKKTAEADENLRALLAAKTPVVTLFGKSWTIHVREALHTTLNHNLQLIHDSLAYLRPHVKTLFYDAEHFFDGFKEEPEYALSTLAKALEAGAECLILCDTNGGNLPTTIREIMQSVRERFPSAPLGIHVHNDGDLAVANSITAVEMGAVQVQGTINGVGERCGNANLCSIIPNLCLKMNIPCLSSENLKKLRSISRFVLELANIPPSRYQPYVGRSAFAHKGGVHISAVEKNPLTYEHISPELVGNRRRILVSDLSGRATIKRKAEDYGLHLDKSDPVAMQVLEELKDLENQGFQFEAAEASFELLVNRAMGKSKRYFELVGFRVIDQKMDEHNEPVAEATILVKVGGHMEHTAALGLGPVNALDNALRKALEKFYPELKDMELSDYKVRVLPGKEGTAARVRVLIESHDTSDHWGTVGVSHDIIEASWQALVDSINYKMYKSEKHHRKS